MPTTGAPRIPEKIQEGIREQIPKQEPRPTTEQPVQLEQREPEYAQEQVEQTAGRIESRPPTESLVSRIRKPKIVPPPQPIVRDELTHDLENIMSDGLTEAFKALPPLKQQEFKMKGEETAREIRALLFSTKVKMKKIFELILDWLKLLPGVNKFFLEQEAKIKAERIMRLKELKKFRP